MLSGFRHVLVATLTLFFCMFWLIGCSTTPDETYKKSQMTRSLDYPPDLVAPTVNKRFSVPQSDAIQRDSAEKTTAQDEVAHVNQGEQ